ncbi:MAG: HDOD domain-containing protein [Phycisphaeraceae bacterium]|nr:HDOD domain-containing protein [Phycisphaeraceae bacterium]
MIDQAVDPSRARHAELVLQQVDALPTLSPVATRLLAVGSADDADLDEIVTLLESDPALTARILGLCRKAAHGLGDRVTTVRRAIIMLGLEAVQSSVLSVSVYDLMSGASKRRRREPAQGSAAFDREGFWKHALGVACAAELFAHRYRKLAVRPDEAFTAGLLHGVGKLALDLVLPEAYQRVVMVAQQRGCDSAPVERGVIGIDHHTAGRRIAERWGIPDELRDVMWLHAQPLSSLPADSPRELIALVTLAKALCREMHIGWSGDFGPPPPSRSVCEQAGLDAAAIDHVATHLHDSAAQRFQVLGLDARPTPQLLLQSIANANRRLGDLYAAADRRARQAKRSAGALEAIETFLADHDAARGTIETIGAIARSAARTLGPTRWSALLRRHEGEPWLAVRFGPEGRVEHAAAVPRDASSKLSAAIASGGRNVPTLPSGALDATGLRAQPSTAFRVQRGTGASQVCLLLSDETPAANDLTPSDALLATWAAALDAAARHEQAQRISEQLAEVNRSLVEARDRLAETEALVRLGEVTAGAAHEMNNPLTVISGRSQLLARRLNDDADRASAEAIARAATDLSDMITALHLLATPPTPAIQRIGLRALIDAAIDEAHRRTGVTPETEIDLGDAPAVIDADRELLVRALSEVICNALEAAPGCLIRVLAQTDPVDSRLLVRIVDQGPGMSAKAARHAFDPFFSEKPAGRQTGLGLTRARRIVEIHGGEIALQSEPDHGTTATISLPLRRTSSGEGSLAA